MKIIILGAGQVGGTLAEQLAIEENDITVVDTCIERLRMLKDRLDIGVIHGCASYPYILKQAGADVADLLIAVTNSDETNMVACQIAYTLFGTPTKIARIRQADYLKRSELFTNDAIAVDVLISPEKAVTLQVERLIKYPGALQVLDFAGGRVQLVAVRAYYGGPLVNQELKTIREHMPNIDTRVVAIFRNGQSIIPKGSTVIEADDEVFFIADRRHILSIISELRRLDRGYRRIFIAGGGNIGLRLAQSLENSYNVKIIEKDMQRCDVLSQTLNRAVILNGSASDKDLLISERIDEADIFIALTNTDETNLMSSLLSKRLGVKKVMTLINNSAYVDLVQGGAIDVAISPQLATISSLLRHVRRCDVANVHSLRRGAAEAIETIAHGDKKNSKVVGRKVSNIALPESACIGAIVRNEHVMITNEDIEIETGDHIIIFIEDRRGVKEVEALFSVHSSFF